MEVEKGKPKVLRKGARLVLNDWINEGIIKEMNEDFGDKSCHCLPHLDVIKFGSSTPIRPVFDVSARDHTNRNSVSLNQCLENGPNLIEKIPAVFARFHRHCRAVFGVSPSPFQLVASIEYDLGQVLAECKSGVRDLSVDLVEQLKGSFYVDNCVTSLDTQTYCLEFMEFTKSIMWERKFDLRGRHVKGELVAQEYNAAEMRQLLLVQQETFDGAFNKRLKTLLPFTDKDGLIRMKTKVSNRADEVEEIGVPDIDLIESTHLNRRFRYRQHLKSTLRQRFRTQYLGQLKLFFAKVSKAVGERLREPVEEDITLDSCPKTSDPDEGEKEPVKSS
ncbi:hypothetical protein ILUMI_21538 [Ignelater luminosus]|uniref:Uncharacterized protein n=1 Tax=Ignelater luminosus TaxID=2038154 RepID=A0A8K0CBW6_IGNLU|nr:hypothetical protein ILUMI_21538 [Ignelater luminosus]